MFSGDDDGLGWYSRISLSYFIDKQGREYIFRFGSIKDLHGILEMSCDTICWSLYRLSMAGLNTTTCCLAISARVNLRINSSVFPENMLPAITSTFPMSPPTQIRSANFRLQFLDGMSQTEVYAPARIISIRGYIIVDNTNNDASLNRQIKFGKTNLVNRFFR